MEEHGADVVTDEGRQIEAEGHVDEEILGEVLMLMEDESADGMMKACDLFRSGVPERFVEIDGALAEGRFEDAARASHSLRGSAGAFGARRLRLLGHRLEQLCRETDGPSAVLVVEEMRAEYLVFQDILDGRLAELAR
ncbi:MAG: Hpt domain-containing protein [Actinomycetota bacterium]|nr:Hpt domain-containing protein [Actinomycetota bacterium]